MHYATFGILIIALIAFGIIGLAIAIIIVAVLEIIKME
jgi:hypothetical protein